MTDQNSSHIFLSYNEANREFVESLARRLQGDARLSFWSGPWHSIPGQPLQEQMEEALWAAGACAVFIGSGRIEGWQNEQMRTAIQTRVEDLIATACQQAPRNMTRIEWQIFMRDQDHRAVCPNLPV